MTLYATAGAKIFIGTAFALSGDIQASDFTGETWTEIKQAEALGDLGDGAEEIEVQLIGEGRKRRLKGNRDAGALETVFAADYADPGQIALIAAEKASGDFAFKIEFNDAPSGGTNSERIFVAQVGSAKEQASEANSEIKLMASLWVNSNIVRVDAAGA